MLPARLSPSKVVRAYTWIAPTHDLLARVVEARARALLLRLAAIQNGEHVLEVGVGTGLSFIEVLSTNPGGRVEGIDITPAMLCRAKRKARRTGHKNYLLRTGNAYAPGVPEASCDVVLCSYVFDLFPEQDFARILKGFHQVLRPGGRLVMANMTVGRVWFEHLWEILYRIHPALLGGCRGVEVLPALRESGFVNVRRTVVRQWLFPSEVLYAERP